MRYCTDPDDRDIHEEARVYACRHNLREGDKVVLANDNGENSSAEILGVRGVLDEEGDVQTIIDVYPSNVFPEDMDIDEILRRKV